MFKSRALFAMACGSSCMGAADISPHTPATDCITPAVRPLHDSIGGYFSVDFLYWTARQESLEFAYDGVADSSTTSVSESGKVYFPNFAWDPGFKLGLGYYTAFDGWDIFAEYTRLVTTISNIAFASGNTTLKKIWYINYSPTTLSQAAANWHLNFNVIDLSLGRNFFISKDLALHPYVGLKSVFYHQDYNVDYDGAVLSLTQPTSSTIEQTQKCSSLGLRSGIDANFWCTKYMSVFGRMAASVLWEKFDVERKDTNFNDPNETSYVSFLNKKTLSIAEPFVEAALGFEFQRYLLNDRLRLGFRTSYEFQIFFDQSQFVRAINDTGGNGGNLTLQGLTLKAQLDF